MRVNLCEEEGQFYDKLSVWTDIEFVPLNMTTFTINISENHYFSHQKNFI